MNEKQPDHSDWKTNGLVMGMVLVLITLLSGEPDLLDAIIAWVGRQS